MPIIYIHIFTNMVTSRSIILVFLFISLKAVFRLWCETKAWPEASLLSLSSCLLIWNWRTHFLIFKWTHCFQSLLDPGMCMEGPNPCFWFWSLHSAFGALLEIPLSSCEEIYQWNAPRGSGQEGPGEIDIRSTKQLLLIQLWAIFFFALIVHYIKYTHTWWSLSFIKPLQSTYTVRWLLAE